MKVCCSAFAAETCYKHASIFILVNTENVPEYFATFSPITGIPIYMLKPRAKCTSEVKILTIIIVMVSSQLCICVCVCLSYQI